MGIAKLALNRFHKEILRKLTGHVPDEALQAVRRGKKTLPDVMKGAPPRSTERRIRLVHA